MKIFLSVVALWTSISCSLALATDGLLEFGPKRSSPDRWYTSIIRNADVPPDLSVLARRTQPDPPYKMLPNMDSDDPRFLKLAPGESVHCYDKKLIESAYINSIILPDYSLLASLPLLKEAWIVADNGQQLPQSVFDALGSDAALQRLVVRGDLSTLDLSPLARTKLEAIEMIEPNLTVDNIRQLSTVKSLCCLELDDRKLSQESLFHLATLRQLRDFRLISKFAQGTDLAFLSRLPKLERLELKVESGPDLVQRIPPLPGLKVLSVPLSDSDLPSLSKFKSLVWLQVTGGHRFTGETLTALRSLPLKYLSLNSCAITSDGFHAISEIKTLQGLDITWTPTTHDDLMALANLPDLINLCASCIGDYSGLEMLSHKLPNCSIWAQTNCPRY